MIDETFSEEQKIAWFAGWFEGEGSIVVTQPSKRGGRYVRMSGASTDEDSIDAIISIVGGNKSSKIVGREAHHKDQWIWTLTKTEDAIALAEKIYPFMTSRRKAQIDHAIENQSWAEAPTRDELFDSHLERQGGCLVWTGAADQFGFGTGFNVGENKRFQAHRYNYLRVKGEVPRRLANMCGNKLCVDPSHWVRDRKQDKELWSQLHCSAVDET